jgi:hypothetical protein
LAQEKGKFLAIVKLISIAFCLKIFEESCTEREWKKYFERPEW